MTRIFVVHQLGESSTAVQSFQKPRDREIRGLPLPWNTILDQAQGIQTCLAA